MGLSTVDQKMKRVYYLEKFFSSIIILSVQLINKKMQNVNSLDLL